MQSYRFMEVSMGCTSVQAMEEFWVRMFDAKVHEPPDARWFPA